ncbi:insulin-like peptide receptor [Centruroides vittatus]|uniref:insulin-like peptide receptor n=1 Tax=Centruroides vittatus TaxID=120091 RepID=UPI00350FFFC2
MIAIILLYFFALTLVRAIPFDQAIDITCDGVEFKENDYIEKFEKYMNCTVIEGNLEIFPFENNIMSDYNMSFPNLREITGYLLLYRISGLRSLEQLFPNLSVIRGNTLFLGYALTVYEMMDLQEIGLRNLTKIVHGNIRIEKNPRLCFVDTIDWNYITMMEKTRNVIRENRLSAFCPNCPKHCPKILKNGNTESLCWNLNYCQKVCNKSCENSGCTASGECCHSKCLGGCTGLESNDCNSCRNVTFNKFCFDKCPHFTFEYLSWRCITETECRKIKTLGSEKIYWKAVDKKCLPNCPSGYSEHHSDNHSCIECKENCRKVCVPPLVIDSIATSKRLRRCTYIDGNLEIQIKGENNVIQALTENLGYIQEIYGYLKIVRSFPLISLNFLRDLRIIYGENKYLDSYSFVLLDNDNLEELWNWNNRHHKLEIRKGKISINFNPKLCVYKIKEMRNNCVIPEWADEDYSQNTNGHRIGCEVMNINAVVWRISPRVAGLKWDNMEKKFQDQRMLFGYAIYYREAPVKNVTIYEGRDACGGDGWTVNDVELGQGNTITSVITYLKPYTQYAFYIRTLTVASSNESAQSPVLYFRTLPGTPSRPLMVQAQTKDDGAVIVTWQPPKHPNGNVTFYMIEIQQDFDPIDFINQYNYCFESPSLSLVKRKHGKTDKDSLREITTVNNNEVNSTSNGTCCSCTPDQDVENQIYFDDYLQNIVYVKINNVSRVKRSANFPDLPTTTFYDSETFTSNYSVIDKEGSVNDTARIPIKYNYTVQGKTTLTIRHLRHFTEYIIKVKACHGDERNSTCSVNAITTVRTLSHETADNIDPSTVQINAENASSGIIYLKWDEPENPNGLIVYYHIEYKILDNKNIVPICITQLQYQQYKGYQLFNLDSGNYSLRLRATSLAGNGNWTSPFFFHIPERKSSLSKELIIVTAFCCVIFVLISISISAWLFYRRKARHNEGILYSSVNPEYISANLVYEPDEWEVDREKISLIKELGQGSFGMVYEGEARKIIPGKPVIRCAVKTVNENASHREKIEFLQEASVMKGFNCFHVVKLLGVVSKGHPVLVLMELMANGDLKTYLRSHRPEENPDCQPPTLKRVLQMSIEIADGMAYLAAKKFVHRDLAARNCMVSEDLTVKIGDFGMTRDIYETDYYRKGGKGLLPVRWMAPESLKDGVFTSQSDVWSYGVVLWEMATLSSQPYQGLSNEQVLKYVMHGGTMEKPENCPEILYMLMSQCWNRNPLRRPTFIDIIEELLKYVTSSQFQKSSFYFSQSNNQDDNDTASTPLKSPTNDNISLKSLNNEMDVYYFPSSTITSETSGNNQINSEQSTNVAKNNKQNCDGSKSMSLTCSDDSQGSKVSNLSNGSAINGSVYFPKERTMMC